MEAQLKKRLKEVNARDLNRLRTLMVMERLLARFSIVFPETTLLKGGLALELRIDGARTTRDIDLRLIGSSHDLAEGLRAVERHRPSPEDHLQFVICPDPQHPTVLGDAVKYDGFRYRVTASMAGKRYAHFGLDIVYGDPIFGEPDLLLGSNFLAPINFSDSLKSLETLKASMKRYFSCSTYGRVYKAPS